MSAVKTGGPAAVRETPQWRAPAPLWTAEVVQAGGDAFRRPWIAELTTDSFLDDFLAILNGTAGRSPADLPSTAPRQPIAGASDRLFRPRHMRYYVVAASLVCHRPGIPDHAVRPRLGERPVFVVRRSHLDGSESAFVPALGVRGSWEHATADALTPGELELPLHPTPVAAFAAPGTAAATLGMAAGGPSTRTVHYGYVPVSRSDPSEEDPTPYSGPYVIRAVLVRPPCPPVLSAPAREFRIAALDDLAAPRRPFSDPRLAAAPRPGDEGPAESAPPKGPTP